MTLLAQAQAYCREQLHLGQSVVLYETSTEGRRHAVSLLQGYQPLSVDYSREDQAAKGLRAFHEGQAPQQAEYFSVADRLAAHPLLLLTGACGSGKTTIARHLLACTAQTWLDEVADTPLTFAVQAVDGCIPAIGGIALQALEAGWPVLLIVDQAQVLDCPRLTAYVSRWRAQFAALRVLVLGDLQGCSDWRLPAEWVRYRLRGLSLPAGGEPVMPAVFALAQAVPERLSALALVERWLAGHPGECTLADSLFVQHLSWASRQRHQSPAQLTAQLLENSAQRAWPLQELGLQQLAEGHSPRAWAEDLLSHDREPEAVLLASTLLRRESAGVPPGALIPALLGLLEDPANSLRQRVAAGRHLADWGDPRDLLQLCPVEAGELTMGSESHVNSRPVHRRHVGAFQIGRYPVSNGNFLEFVDSTGRPWHSQQGREPQRRNFPAVDLTWHDATAFCHWLTEQWLATGRLSAGQEVRLPSEVEWEYAARGAQRSEGLVYPWAGEWQEDASNSEHAGLNDTCSVGVFSRGRSVWGCEDLCGQVWEWTSTLWGEDMTRPARPYPLAIEDLAPGAAPAGVRRVLRGGCFSSPPEKANCTYRGSLEPAGFWRGNGFRIALG